MGIKVSYLMSFRPIFGEQVLAGVKSHEVRKFLGRIEEGSWVLVYESTPVKAFTGIFQVGRVDIVDENRALELIRGFRGYSELDLPYIVGRKKLIVIEVRNPIRFYVPVTLDDVRRYFPSFRPPISYVRVKSGTLLCSVCEFVLRKGLYEET